jgi:hypothetical protein
MSIENISSAPDYIHKFVNDNYEQLIKIYKEGLETDEDGLLFCKCSDKDNRIDVQCMNTEMIVEIITKDTWDSLKQTIKEDKKLLFIQDLDLECIFLLYV